MKIVRNFILLIMILLASKINAKDDNLSSFKVAIIDMYYLLENSLAVQQVKEQLKIYNQKIASKLELKENELRKLDVKSRSFKTSETQAQAQDQDVLSFNNKVKEMRAEIKDKNIKLEKAYTDAMKKIDDATKKIVQRLSKKYGFYIAIPSSQIYYGSNKVDITQEVLLLLNTELAYLEIELENL